MYYVKDYRPTDVCRKALPASVICNSEGCFTAKLHVLSIQTLSQTADWPPSKAEAYSGFHVKGREWRPEGPMFESRRAKSRVDS